MCGIAGVLGGVDPARIVQQMLDQQVHRGPDGEGVWESEIGEGRTLCLGHRRLAILDLSSAGAQPMADAIGRFVITYNGEIYDYLEFRAELERLSARLRSHSDTEVIVEATSTGVQTVCRASIECLLLRCTTVCVESCFAPATATARSRSCSVFEPDSLPSPPNTRHCCSIRDCHWRLMSGVW